MSRHQPLSQSETSEQLAVRDLRSMGANAGGNAANENQDGKLENIAQMPLSPGQKLKQARERQGLSIAEVAAQLRLSKDCIASLERDAFDCLPGNTFTRGYIRSYANLVKVNPDELINLFDASFEEQETVPETESIRVTRGKTKFQPWLSYSIAAIFLLLAASWWWMRGDGTGVEVIESVEVQAATGELIVETMDVSEPTPLVNSVVASAVAIESVEIAETTIIRSDAEIPLTEPASSQEPLASAEVEPPIGTQSDDVQLAVAESTGSGIETVEAVTMPAEPVVLDQLSISFINDCWVQIYDANGDRVHADLERANQSLQVAGIAPLKVKFGNWRAVSDIQFNEKQIPIPQSQRGDVVQFTITR